MTSRVYFKKFISEEDFKYFSKLVFNEKIMVMNYGRVFTMDEAKNYYKYLLENNETHDDFGNFKVFESSANSFIGMCASTISSDLKEAEIEYMLLPEYWRKGYGSEIVDNLLNMIEETKSIEKVTAITDPNNVGSRKILLKNGFVSCKVYKIDDGSLAERFSKKIMH
ncbi:GNAT family N-acetyltransferase [Clostridium sp. KNHs214]|uniref:GNAT family N-acetyltransferase n=1 Tax=Clostridium sp. KNHs214 TaxID=1540257 RepID=UPI00069208D0|nr:GNAT family N-acetyltransferase [Clostridium sp. KNHs214]